MTIGDLAEQARTFAGEQSDLLNRTVTNGIRLGYALAPGYGVAHIGFGVRKESWTRELIPLTLTNAPPRASLYITHIMKLDPEGQYLTDGRTAYGVYRATDEAQPLFRYDYVRNNAHHFEAHFHIEGDFAHGDVHGVRPPRKLHFPVGGRRFRPSLEDLIELLIREGFADGRDGWRQAVDESRQRWYEKQLRAAVRRSPEVARDTLADLA